MAVTKQAIVVNDECVNVVLVDDESNWTPDEGTLIPVAEDERVAAGWTRVNSAWVEPDPPAAVDPPIDLKQAIIDATDFADLQATLSG